MASIFQVFDWKQSVAEKKHLNDRRFTDGGFEAPRNSLDIPHDACDPPRKSSARPDDVPFGYEFYKSRLSASARRPMPSEHRARSVSAHEYSGESDSKRRAPSVVARLMGLDALPDDLPPIPPRRSCNEIPAYPYPRPLAGNAVLTRQHSQGAVTSNRWPPPLPRHAHRLVLDEDERVPVEVLPFRDHPQEKQLQEFKKEFAANQLAGQMQGSRPSQVEDMKQQLEEKKNQVRATLDEAKLALQVGNMSDQKRQLAREKLAESKEFLDAMEFLQCNQEFFFQFLQQKPDIVFSHQPPVSEASKPLSSLKTTRRGRGDSSPGESSRRDGFSPRAFARQFLESRRRYEAKQQQAKVMSGSDSRPSSTSQPELSRCSSMGSKSRSSDFELPEKAMPAGSSSTKSRASRPPVSPKISLKPSRSVSDGRSSSKEGAQQLVREAKERAKQRERDGLSQEVRCFKEIKTENLQGSSRDSKEIAREIARQARGGAKDSLRNNVTLHRSSSTGKRITLRRGDLEEAAFNSDGEGPSTPSSMLSRGHVSRSCISLPSSPRPSRAREEAATKVVRKSTLERPRLPFTEQSASPRLLPFTEQSASPRLLPLDTVVGKKNVASLESPHVGAHTKAPIRASIEAKGSPVAHASRATEVANQRVATPSRKEAAPPSSSRCRDQATERPNLARCRSVPNVAFLRERGQCADTPRSKPSSTIGRNPTGLKSSGKIKPEVTKPAYTKNARDQISEKRRGFFSLGRKKAQHNMEEVIAPGQQLVYPSSAPVFARVVALAESCVSQSHTLSDADNAINRTSHRRISSVPSEEEVVEVLPFNTAKPTTVVTGVQPQPALEESVVPESSADSSPYPCEDDVLEVLSQLTPTVKLRVAVEDATTGPSIAATTTSQKQFHIDKRNRKPPRPWAIGRDVLDNVVDEGADLNNDKNGQPSPVSVLDSPFEEESPSPPEFKEITNELRIRLRLLKVDGSERPRADLENVPERHLEFAENLASRDTPRGDSASLLDSICESRATSMHEHKHPVDRLLLKFQGAQLSSVKLCARDSPCTEGREDDHSYVSNVLETSGFAAVGGCTRSRWHSPAHPLSKSLFDRLEAISTNKKGASNRQILFHVINEILVEKLGHHCQEQPWLNLRIHPTASGKKLVEEVWGEICEQKFDVLQEDVHDDYLESLVARDLKSSDSWLSLHQEVDQIGQELERTIFNDLIEDVVQGLLSVQ